MADPIRLSCGVDTGGTFTDCVAIGDDGTMVTAKTLSTPPAFADGFFTGLRRLAEQLGLTLPELLARTTRLVHGTTVATNVLVERRGATVGLLATRGHRDALFVMRGVGRVLGLRPEEALNGAHARKPPPLVSRAHAVEVIERVNWRGEPIVELDEDHACEAIRSLLADGVNAIAIALLWGFRNPRHEMRLAELVRELAPAVPISLASSLAPRTGEYERTVTAVIDAYVKPATVGYLSDIENRCRALGYERPLLIMQCDGTVAPVGTIIEAPILTVESGPAAGLEAARMMGAERSHRRIVVFDMGGTTSDIGLVVDGASRRRTTSVHEQYEFYVPSVEVDSTGIGGGSIASVSEYDGALRVGPRSAGADPGPACYARGGRDATVTDADLVLGRIDPSARLGDGMSLNSDAAREVIGTLALRLGLDETSSAAGVSRLAELQVAQEIRKLTISRGYDPRDFVLYAYGGAGPVHAAAVASELGIATVVVPLARAASLWSAYGAARCDLGGSYERSIGASEPFDTALIERELEALAARARDGIRSAIEDPDGIELHFAAGLRYRAQVHEVWVPCPAPPLDGAGIDRLVVAFEREYEQLFGRGTGYRAAGIEFAALRCVITERAGGQLSQATLVKPERGEHRLAHAQSEVPATRQVYWPGVGAFRASAVVSGVPREGDAVEGPALIELGDTTVPVPPGATASMDRVGNLILELAPGRGAEDAASLEVGAA